MQDNAVAKELNEGQGANRYRVCCKAFILVSVYRFCCTSVNLMVSTCKLTCLSYFPLNEL